MPWPPEETEGRQFPPTRLGPDPDVQNAARDRLRQAEANLAEALVADYGPRAENVPWRTSLLGYDPADGEG